MKRIDPIARAKKASEALSKVHFQKVNFSSKELISALKIYGFPYFNEGLNILKKAKLIKKDSEGYHFTTKEPIHFSVLRPFLDEVAEKYCAYASKKEVTVKEVEKFSYIVIFENNKTLITDEKDLLKIITESLSQITIEKIKHYG